MKTTQRILAILAGLGMMALGVFSAVMTRNMRYIFADLGDGALPLPSLFFLSVPMWAFLCVGAACAIASGLLLWRFRRAWLSIPAFVLIFMLGYLYLGVLSISMLAPIFGRIGELDRSEAESGEPAGGVYSNPSPDGVTGNAQE